MSIKIEDFHIGFKYEQLENDSRRYLNQGLIWVEKTYSFNSPRLHKINELIEQGKIRAVKTAKRIGVIGLAHAMLTRIEELEASGKGGVVVIVGAKDSIKQEVKEPFGREPFIIEQRPIIEPVNFIEPRKDELNTPWYAKFDKKRKKRH